MKPTIYVVKEQVTRDSVGPKSMDYTPAMQYGDLEFITEYDIPLHSNSNLARKWHEQVAKFVAKYNDERDFIILTGQPMAFFLVGYLLSQSGKTPRFLVWRREESKYIPYVPVIDSPVIVN